MNQKNQRIAYLVQMADLSSDNGIAKKIRHQVNAWRQGGAIVRIFSLAPSSSLWVGFDEIDVELMRRGGPMVRLWRSHRLCRHIRTWAPDVIYFRCAYHSPGLPALFRRIPTVAEINSDDMTEYPLTLSMVKQFYHRLTRKSVFQAIAGMVPVTRELASRFAHFGKPALIIGNGIDLAEVSILPPPDPWLPLRMVFIGSAGSPWHGLDRIGELATLFPALTIDIIGCTAADWRHSLSPSPAPHQPANLVFHGYLGSTDYLPLISAATAALGTFGLYRKQMDEACPLKVREYLALGLPVIAACHDTDIPDSADYYLRLPNSATSLSPHVGEITRFLARWCGRRVPRSSIAHLDLGVKESDRLAFMKRITAESHPAA